MNKLSVIIVNYNTKKLTLQCIKSVIEEGYGILAEIIVVDNGSTDGSLAELVKLTKSIKLIKNEKNLGFAKANNQGIKIAKGKYILLLNSDTIVKKGTLQKLVHFAENKDDAGAVVPKLMNSDGSVQASVYNFPTLQRAVRQYWFGEKDLLDKYYPTDDTAVVIDMGVMAAFLITPSALKKIGLLNERYFMYYEDFDYCRELRKAGLKTYYLPTAEVIHHHGASGNNVKDTNEQWKRLIPGSIIYHGRFRHYLLNFIIWSGQKFR